MTERALLAVVAGFFVGLVGVLVRYYGALDLIAGYDPDTVEDDTGLADFVGANALYVAALTVAVGVVEYATLVDGTWHWTAYAVLVVALAARMVYGSRRYETTTE